MLERLIADAGKVVKKSVHDDNDFERYLN